MATIRELWGQHRLAGFPDGLRGAEQQGEDLVLLDADIVGCVQAFLANGDRLDDQRAAVLEVCYQKVSSIELSLEGDQRVYFARLRQMAQDVLLHLHGT